MAPWGWILVWSETCRGERILLDFIVFFNKYMHDFVTIDTDFIDARFNYETSVEMFICYNTCHATALLQSCTQIMGSR